MQGFAQGMSCVRISPCISPLAYTCEDPGATAKQIPLGPFYRKANRVSEQ